MAVILQDAGHPQSPPSSSTQRRPAPDFEAEAVRGRLELGGDELDRMAFGRNERRTLGDEIAAASRAKETAGPMSYELRSHGGYAHVVTGIVAYLDEEAQTYMVRASDGELCRVPIRDIHAVRAIPGGHDDHDLYDAVDGATAS